MPTPILHIRIFHRLVARDLLGDHLLNNLLHTIKCCKGRRQPNIFLIPSRVHGTSGRLPFTARAKVLSSCCPARTGTPWAPPSPPETTYLMRCTFVCSWSTSADYCGSLLKKARCSHEEKCETALYSYFSVSSHGVMLI
jgi:hypothetical protein